MHAKISTIRREYTLKELSEQSVLNEPLGQFSLWLQEAIESRAADPTAMTLATAGNDGRPSARIVLLKDIKGNGLSFYTNYNSKKGIHLAENPFASLLFFWPELERQVRFEGITEKLPSGESNAYFDSRPGGSKLGAWASDQSRPLASREALEEMISLLTMRFKGGKIPRPEYWGGYILIPDKVEFWQGRANRLHDRILYKLRENRWELERLSP